MIKGSCMCGEVTYAIHGKVGEITHCHCTTCQKHMVQLFHLWQPCK